MTLKYLPYAGIGSRQTPSDVLRIMTRAAARLADLGWTLRSGAAEGADQAFENGAGEKNEIFVPWKGFMGSSSSYVEPYLPNSASEIASQIHPAWTKLKHSEQKLMARNSRQILGANLDSPVLFVLCWTPDGCEHADTRSWKTGGTGQAIALATRMTSAPVFNLKNPDTLNKVADFIKNYPLKT